MEISKLTKKKDVYYETDFCLWPGITYCILNSRVVKQFINYSKTFIMFHCKPKKFFIAAIMNLVGTTLVTLSITFLVFRSAFMNSQVVLFNPLDVFVIAFTVAAGIYLGFMIKNLVVAIRHNVANKKKEKLKLDADSVDDGTN